MAVITVATIEAITVVTGMAVDSEVDMAMVATCLRSCSPLLPSGGILKSVAMGMDFNRVVVLATDTRAPASE